MPVPTVITDLSQTAASNYPAGSDSPATLDDTQRAHGAFIAQLRDGKGFANPVTIASATTTDIGGQNSQFVEISGTTTITSFGTTYNGPRYLRFTGALLLTYNATTLNLPGAANITTAAGDTAIAVPNLALNGWNVVAYQRAATASYAAAGINSDITGLTGLTSAIAEIRQIQPISASVSANALTISASALALEFRSATLTSGAVTFVEGTPSNLVISSGSTLGTTSAVQSRIAVLALNNAGTIELAAVNISGGVDLFETGLISTTAEGGAGGADSATVIYSTTSRSNVAYRVLGYIESTQATAGTWATAPSTIQGQGGNALTGLPRMRLVAPVATTSGTSIDFTSIPSWVNRITVMFSGVSTASTSPPIIQIGASGTPQTTGYLSTGNNFNNGSGTSGNNSTTGFLINAVAASDVMSGHMVLTRVTGNTWVASHAIKVATNNVCTGGGDVTLSGTLDMLRLTTSAGGIAFDAGYVNLLLEGY